MVVVCWSVKGGVGTTVVAAALALAATRRGKTVLLVDLAGDLASVLGVDGSGIGVSDWCCASGGAGVEALDRLTVEVAGGTRLLVRGGSSWSEAVPERLVGLGDDLAARPGVVVVDAGDLWTAAPPVGPPAGLVDPLLGVAERSLLVTRACYLGLRRLSRQERRPTEVVLVVEPGRALDRHDVEAVVGAPVTIRVPMDPAVARSVDAGLLARRIPRSLIRAVESS
jgi:hypothetical protein